MAQNNNQYALITGGSSGIGYELTKLFAQDGYHLILVARTMEDLEQIAKELSTQYGVTATPIAKDLFNSKAAFELYDEVKAKGITVNVLINDARQGQYGLFAESDIHRQLAIIQLDISSLTALIYLFLKDIIVLNDGKVLQLTSIASEVPGPWQAVYHATKAYVLSFTEALVNELKDTNIIMTAFQPGATATDFFNKAQMQESKIMDTKMSDPAQVARDGYKALMKGDDKIVSGMKNKAMVSASNVMPDTMMAEQMNKMQKPKDKDKKK